MSLKSLGIASRGLLKRGAKKALHIATRGLIRFDDGPPEPIFVSPGGYNPRGRMVTIDPPHLNNNNLVLILAESGVI